MRFSSFMNVEPSATVAINSLAWEKKARGERIFNLSAGEPMVSVHPAVIIAAKAAIDAGKTRYPPVNGIPELRAAFSDWMNKTYQTNFVSEQTLVTCGGKFGIYAACQALLNPGDEALVIAPFWVSYPEIIKLFGGVVKIVPTPEVSWKVSPEALSQAVSSKTKLLIINNGGNPTGVLYSREELAVLLAFAKAHELIVISDEVYSGLTYESKYVSCGSFAEYADRVLVIQSTSKHFSMTGWRVGFALGPLELIQKMSIIQSQSTTGTASISQYAALGAVEAASEIVPLVCNAMRQRRDIFVEKFSTLFKPIKAPAAGLYVFVSLKDLGAVEADSVVFCKQILQKTGVTMVPGAAFGQEGYVRFSFGAKEDELLESLAVLHNFLLDIRN